MDKRTLFIISITIVFCFLIIYWNRLDVLFFKNIKGQSSRLEVSIEENKKMIIDLNKKLADLKLQKEIENKKSEKAHVNIFDLNSNLVPEIYDQIKCRKSVKYIVETTLCIHPIEKDIHVSKSIWESGVWEGQIIDLFTKYINECPNCLIFDLGSNIGVYTLYAAKMGKDVVAVEPFHDNILRIHKAAKSEKIENKITLVKNGLSDRRNHVMHLVPDPLNVGGQYLKDENNLSNMLSKYVIETIVFDDMIDYFPKRPDGNPYDRAIIKIDIQGFEPYAFQNATRFLEKFKIEYIFMEWWLEAYKSAEKIKLVENMITILISNKLKPMTLEGLDLKRENWKSWPWDMIWKRT